MTLCTHLSKAEPNHMQLGKSSISQGDIFPLTLALTEEAMVNTHCRVIYRQLGY